MAGAKSSCPGWATSLEQPGHEDFAPATPGIAARTGPSATWRADADVWTITGVQRHFTGNSYLKTDVPAELTNHRLPSELTSGSRLSKVSGSSLLSTAGIWTEETFPEGR